MRLVKGLVHRCVEVIETMAGASGSVRLSDLASTLDLPKSAAHRLLQELRALGWVEQDGHEAYRLTMRFALLGHAVLRESGLPELVAPILDALAARTRELVRLTLATDHGLTWFACAQGAPPGLVFQPDMAGPLVLHATANGKAYLATLPDETALGIATAGGLGRVRLTPHTITTPQALLADLATVRVRGYALADQEAEPGVTAVSVAVRTATATIGTLSVAGPSLRIGPTEIPALATDLASTARTLAQAWPVQRATRKDATA